MRFDKEYSDYMHGKCKNYNQGLFEALEEMEKEGEGNMIYNDNSCSNCGGVRVKGSTLCASCWQMRLRYELRQKRALQGIIDGQDLAIGKLRALCERLLGHIINDRVSAAELATSIFENWKRKEKEAGDGKDRVSGNT